MYLPDKFCDEMKRILGDEYEDYLASMDASRKYGLRVNTAKMGFIMTKKSSRRNTLIILPACIIFRIPVR